MRVVANQSKAAARIDKKRMNCFQDSMNGRTFIYQEDCAKAIKTAKAKLQSVMETAKLDFAESEDAWFLRVKKKYGIVMKWNINFIALLVLTGGGQRPQVFSQLQIPTGNLDEDESWDLSEEKMFGLGTLFEKTERDASILVVLFPSAVKEYVRFHVDQIRPVILKYLGKVVESSSLKLDESLLLHTSRGEYISPRSITLTFRKFMENMNAKFDKVSVMTYRSCFATDNWLSFRDRKIGAKLTEWQFMELMAKRMNTSVHQLKTAYVKMGSRDFEDCVQVAMEHFNIVMGEDVDNFPSNYEAQEEEVLV